MIIDELHISADYQLARIMNLLENLYGITLDFDSSISRFDLERLYEYYDSVRKTIIRESQYNTYNQNPDYARAGLIQQAISIFLSEIAPKRLNRRRTGSQVKDET